MFVQQPSSNLVWRFNVPGYPFLERGGTRKIAEHLVRAVAEVYWTRICQRTKARSCVAVFADRAFLTTSSTA
jgi:hypothetical protein